MTKTLRSVVAAFIAAATLAACSSSPKAPNSDSSDESAGASTATEERGELNQARKSLVGLSCEPRGARDVWVLRGTLKNDSGRVKHLVVRAVVKNRESDTVLSGRQQLFTIEPRQQAKVSLRKLHVGGTLDDIECEVRVDEAAPGTGDKKEKSQDATTQG